MTMGTDHDTMTEVALMESNITAFGTSVVGRDHGVSTKLCVWGCEGG